MGPRMIGIPQQISKSCLHQRCSMDCLEKAAMLFTQHVGLFGEGLSHPAVAVPAALAVVDHPGVLVADALGIPGKVFSEHHGRRRPQL